MIISPKSSSRFFGNVNGISTRIEELVIFRNPAAHNRPIFGPLEYQEIIVACRTIFQAMEIELPSLFQSWTDGNAFVEAADRRARSLNRRRFCTGPKM